MLKLSASHCREEMPTRLPLSTFRLGQAVKVWWDDNVWRNGKIVAMKFDDDWEIQYAVQCGIDGWWGPQKNVRKR